MKDEEPITSDELLKLLDKLFLIPEDTINLEICLFSNSFVTITGEKFNGTKITDIEQTFLTKRKDDMSTNDVPGHRKSNNDELAMGCWAEHDDGSLIFVESSEGGRVIYSMFDLGQKPIIEYRDSMPEKGFKEYFSFDAKKTMEKWTWHDKTPFPWNKVIKKGAKDGVRYASASDQISAAKKVSKSLKIKGKKFKDKEHNHMVKSNMVGANIAKSIVKNLQKEISKLKF